MKTKILALFSTVLICILIFSFCNNRTPHTSNLQGETTLDSTTSLDKYAGLYVFMKYGFSINRFPQNSKVHTEIGDKYPSLDKRFIGQYFMVENKLSYDTSIVAGFAGGYIAPPVGNILTNVAEDGTITIMNYDNYGTNANTLLMSFNLSGTTTYGKFIPRADGHYDLVVNNATYTWTK